MKSEHYSYIVLSFLKNFLFISYIYIFVTVPSVLLRDRLPYETIAEDSDFLIKNYGSNIVLHEPIFLLINSILIKFLDSSIIPLVFVFFITFSIALFLSKLSANFLFFLVGLLSFVFSPGFFHLQLVTLRQGLATILMVWILLYIKDKNKVSFLIFVLGFIHASFFLFFLIYIFYIFYRKIFQSQVRINILVSISISVILLFSFKIGEFIGIYQFSYIENEVTGFLGFFLYLFTFLYLFFFLKPDDFKNRVLYDLALIFMLISVLSFFTIPFLGRYSISFFVFVYLVLIQKSSILNFMFIFLLLLIYIYQFYSGVVVNQSTLSNSLTGLGFPWFL